MFNSSHLLLLGVNLLNKGRLLHYRSLRRPELSLVKDWPNFVQLFRSASIWAVFHWYIMGTLRRWTKVILLNGLFIDFHHFVKPLVVLFWHTVAETRLYSIPEIRVALVLRRDGRLLLESRLLGRGEWTLLGNRCTIEEVHIHIISTLFKLWQQVFIFVFFNVKLRSNYVE